VISPDEAKRLLALASNLKARVMLSLSYGCGLRAGEVVRLKVKHIDSAQEIIRIEQSKGRKDRNVMLSPEMLALLRQWWKARPSRYDAGTPVQQRWLFPSRKSAGKPLTTPATSPVEIKSCARRKLLAFLQVSERMLIRQQKRSPKSGIWRSSG
jgi:integrase/recombinase XerD